MKNNRQTLLDYYKDNKFSPEQINMLMGAFDEYTNEGSTFDEAVAKLLKRFFKPPAATQEAKANIDWTRAMEIELRKGSSRLNEGQVSAIMQTFASTAAKYGGEKAFSIIHESYANGHAADAKFIHEAYAGTLNVLPTSKMSREIAEDLEKINNENTVNSNTKSRLRKVIENYRTNLGKFGNVTLTSAFTRTVDILSPEEIEKVQNFHAGKDKQNIAAMTSFGSFKKSFNMTKLDFELS